MPSPTHGRSLPSPHPDSFEWVADLLEDHRRIIMSDIALQLEPLHSHVKTLTSMLETEGHSDRNDNKSPYEADREEQLSSRTPKSEESAAKHEPETGVEVATQMSMPRSRQSITRIVQQVEEVSENGDSSLDASKRTRSVYDHEIREVVDKVRFSQNKPDMSASNRTHILDLFVAAVITINVLVMLVELEYQTFRSKISLGKVKDGGEWNNAEQWFDVIEHIFNTIFIGEIIVRFRLLGFAYFQSSMNRVDLTLVLATSIQMYIFEPLRVKTGGQLTLFRMLRFFRSVRLLKILRLRVFTALRVLVQTCISSLAALAWSMVLLFLIMFMAGIFLGNLLMTSIQDESNDIELRNWVFHHYGSSARATYTLFEVTLSGCWPTYFRPLIERVSTWYVVFTIIYISVVVFAVLRIITAIFLKQTLTVASNDADMVVVEQKAAMERTIQKLHGIFKQLDSSGDGLLHLHEFEIVINDPEVKSWLSQLDVHVHDVEGLFQLLDDGDGAITYEEFLAGMLRLKGQARSLDVVALSRNCDHIESTVLTIEAKLDLLTKAFQGSASTHISQINELKHKPSTAAVSVRRITQAAEARLALAAEASLQVAQVREAE